MKATTFPAGAHGVADLDVQRSRALRQWWSALANRHFAPVRIAILGDSFTEGVGATTRPNRWADRLRDQLRARFPSDGVGSGGGAGFLAANSAASNSAWTYSGTVDAGANWFGWGGLPLILEANGAYMQTTVTGTSVDIIDVTGGGLTVSVTVDGGSPTTYNQGSGATDGNAHRVSLGAVGSHTVRITAPGPAVYIDGAIVYNGDENAGIHMIPMGHSGWASGDFVTLLGGYSTQAIGPQDADLWIVELGLNDQGTAVTPVAFRSNLETLISTAKSVTTGKTPSFALAAPVDVAVGTYPWASYVDAMWAVAAADDNVCVYDGRQRMGPTGATPLFAGDTFHPSDRGHAFLADSLLGFLSPSGS